MTELLQKFCDAPHRYDSEVTENSGAAITFLACFWMAASDVESPVVEKKDREASQKVLDLMSDPENAFCLFVLCHQVATK